VDNQVILEVKNISKAYPGVRALDGVSMDFRKGEVHAIIGENGAGKSTLIKAIAGAHAPSSGEIVVNGTTYTKLTIEEAKKQGIQVIYQEFANVPTLNAPDNVFLGKRTSKGWIVNDKERIQRTKEIFQRLKVDIPLDMPLGDMSPAMQQIVEIAKAISDDVKILIMDEPTAPLTNNEIEMLFGIIRQLQADGVAIIYISHRLEELPVISDRISILRDGTYIKTVDTKDVSRGELISMMAGRALDAQYPERNQEIGEVMLEVENAAGNGVSQLNFQLHRGEILGFAGLVGAGRTETMQLLYGVAPLKSGSIRIGGKEQRFKHPSKAIEAGVAMIPEDRKNQGVFLNQSIRWNTVINIIKRISRFGVVSSKRERDIAEDYQKRFSIKAPSLDQDVNNLSGGNQQKVALAKSMAAESDIIIFDEPTRGIDVATKYDIYVLMNQLVAQGKAILMVSSEMPELIGMCDRIVVLSERKQVAIVEKEQFSQEYILDLASGDN
jgi:ribose transport system ATP-binding protein